MVDEEAQPGGNKDLAYFRDCVYRILEGRDHSRHELRQKLRRRSCPEEFIDTLIEEMCACRYLDDQRFATALVQSKLRQGWGRRRIALELKRRGLADEDIETALSEFTAALEEEGELERARVLAQRRINSGAAVDKIYRYLWGRGFSASCINSVLSEFRVDDSFLD